MGLTVNVSFVSIHLFSLCAQGEAESWREPVNGAESGPGSLRRDHKATRHLRLVAVNKSITVTVFNRTVHVVAHIS